MRTIIIFLVGFLPLYVNAQLEKSIIKLLEDKSSIYIDSTIMYVTDTNNRNRAMQPHGVWRTRNNVSKTLLSISSNFDGRMHGHVLGFYSNGQIAHSVYYYFDVLNGPSVSFWQNGSPFTSMFYKNGLAEGVIKNFDSSGHLIKITEVKQGKKEGIEIQLYPSGNMQSVTQYSADEENGLRREYKDSDKIEIVVEYEMKNGVPVIGRFYESGTLIKTENYNYEEQLRKKDKLRKQEKISDG
jgi:antitoxin component YwqK of YwqJK toxin-antitoxin module